MIILGFAIIFLIIYGIMTCGEDKFFSFVTAIILMFSFGVIQYSFRYKQLNDIEKIYEFQNKKVIYEKMAETQLIEFKRYLGEKYPDLERKIFDNLSLTNIDIYLVQYPQIKSSETLIKLTDLINEKTSKVYECDLKIIEYKKNVSLRIKDSKAWCIPGVVAEYTEK